VSDNLYNGQKLRCLTIVDNHTWICTVIGVGFRYTACNVIETLNLAVERYGTPECIQWTMGLNSFPKNWISGHTPEGCNSISIDLGNRLTMRSLKALTVGLGRNA
jgi:hypothetical protein